MKRKTQTMKHSRTFNILQENIEMFSSYRESLFDILMGGTEQFLIEHHTAPGYIFPAADPMSDATRWRIITELRALNSAIEDMIAKREYLFPAHAEPGTVRVNFCELLKYKTHNHTTVISE